MVELDRDRDNATYAGAIKEMVIGLGRINLERMAELQTEREGGLGLK